MHVTTFSIILSDVILTSQLSITICCFLTYNKHHIQKYSYSQFTVQLHFIVQSSNILQSS